MLFFVELFCLFLGLFYLLTGIVIAYFATHLPFTSCSWKDFIYIVITWPSVLKK